MHKYLSTRQLHPPSPLTNLFLSSECCEEFNNFHKMRNLLNVTAHMIGKASGLDRTRNSQACTKRARHDKNICSLSSKGVVALLSGNWATHVYINDNWICIGIFKTKKEAVMAYESTTTKLLIECLHKNLQKTSNAAPELNIQKQACINGTHNIPQVHGKLKWRRTRLFEKVVTPSDVSKLNRIVIPKMYSSCFPTISNGNESSSEVRPVNEELAFYDRSMTLWKFRYTCWKGGNSYVFSGGWRNFVQEKQLSSKDKVIFFKCEHAETELVVHTYFAIDVEYHADRAQLEEASGKRGKNVFTNGEEFHSREGVQNLDDEQNHHGTACTMHEMNIEVDNDLERTGSGKAPETSFKLFGVKIA